MRDGKRGTDLAAAVTALRAGGCIAYPTEGVYGIGCDALDEPAVRALLALKQRPADKGLIVIGASLPQLEPLLHPLTREQRTTLEANWPGAVTWVVPAAADAPKLLTGGRDHIAVRVPGHDLARELCHRFRGPVVSTSANLTGAESARDPDAVAATFGDRLDYLLEGPLGDRPGPSELRELATGRVLRAGSGSGEANSGSTGAS